jgi:hypothetical protein
MMEAAQSERVSELQRPNTELRAKLEQTRLKIAKIEEHQNSLRSGYTKLEDECEVLRHAAESLKREKAETETAHETEVTTAHVKFHDYCVRHRRKLRDLRFHLEKAVNEFGAGCLPYPGKNSTISDIIGWSDNEIKALPATVVKANLARRDRLLNSGTHLCSV